MSDGSVELEARLRAAFAEPEAPPAELVARTLRRASAELAAERRFARELLRLFAAIALPLAAVIAANLVLISLAPGLLAGFVPEAAAHALPWLYAFGTAGWLTLFIAGLPTLAFASAAHRRQEALS